MTPPNVLPAPNPVSSVMMSRMFGAPFGGTTRGGHHGFDWSAFRSTFPPNGRSGPGSCFPSSVTVADGDPGAPSISATAAVGPRSEERMTTANKRADPIMEVLSCPRLRREAAGWPSPAPSGPRSCPLVSALHALARALRSRDAHLRLERLPATQRADGREIGV